MSRRHFSAPRRRRLEPDGQALVGPAEQSRLTEGAPRASHRRRGFRTVATRRTSSSATTLEEARARRGEDGLGWRVEQLRAAHQDWWRDFWNESEIDIGDDFLELFYYGSFYLMACCSRNTDFAPAISGIWTPTDHPHWGADYHMNYNHQAPWWGCYGANHIGITEPYDTPVLQYLERGKYMAERYLGKKGILYCVGIGPLGSCSCWEKDHHKWDDDSYDKHFFAGQKSNASWGGVNMVMRWRCTLDDELCPQRSIPICGNWRTSGRTIWSGTAAATLSSPTPSTRATSPMSTT